MRLLPSFFVRTLLPRPLSEPHDWRANAKVLACVADRDCWPTPAFLSLPVPQPTAHIPGQIVVRVVAEAVDRARDCGRWWRSQSEDLRGAPLRDSRSRNTPERRPHCTGRRALALRGKWSR